MSIPRLTSFSCKDIFKKLADKYDLDPRVVEQIVNSQFKFLRIFLQAHVIKGTMLFLPNLGKFYIYTNKNTYTKEQKREYHIIINLIRKFRSVGVTEEEAKQILDFKAAGGGVVLVVTEQLKKGFLLEMNKQDLSVMLGPEEFDNTRNQDIKDQTYFDYNSEYNIF